MLQTQAINLLLFRIPVNFICFYVELYQIQMQQPNTYSKADSAGIEVGKKMNKHYR